MTTTSTAELEPLTYSHQITTETLNNNIKCTLCNKVDVLMRLPEEFQEFAAQKGFESFYCTNCIQVVNFCI